MACGCNRGIGYAMETHVRLSSQSPSPFFGLLFTHGGRLHSAQDHAECGVSLHFSPGPRVCALPDIRHPLHLQSARKGIAHLHLKCLHLKMQVTNI